MGNLHTAKSSPAVVEQSLRKPTDGYLAQFDRGISISISRKLMRTSATPNHVTTAGLAIGLLGSVLLATGAYSQMLFGTWLLWAACVLDGCDGELARIKGL